MSLKKIMILPLVLAFASVDGFGASVQQNCEVKTTCGGYTTAQKAGKFVGGVVGGSIGWTAGTLVMPVAGTAAGAYFGAKTGVKLGGKIGKARGLSDEYLFVGDDKHCIECEADAAIDTGGGDGRDCPRGTILTNGGALYKCLTGTNDKWVEIKADSIPVCSDSPIQSKKMPNVKATLHDLNVNHGKQVWSDVVAYTGAVCWWIEENNPDPKPGPKPDPKPNPDNNNVAACKTSNGYVKPGVVIDAPCINPMVGMTGVTFPNAAKCGVQCVNGGKNEEWLAGIMKCNEGYKLTNPVGNGMYGKCVAEGVVDPTDKCDCTSNSISMTTIAMANANASCAKSSAVTAAKVAITTECAKSNCNVQVLNANISIISRALATANCGVRYSFDENKITNAVTSIDKRVAGFDTSVWKNAEGKFNTARLASDSIAGVVLGTVGGVVTGVVVKKNQVKKGFEDISCTVGGQVVGGYGDEIRVGMQ